jgi:hypothetical protein
MTIYGNNSQIRTTLPVRTLTGITLALMLFAHAPAAQSQTSQSQTAGASTPEPKPDSDNYQTLYLTQQNDAQEIVTDLRNIISHAKVYYVPSQAAISVKGSAADIQLAQKVLSDIDRPRKAYRLTYTITEVEDSKRLGVQHFTLIVVSGGKTSLKQGQRVPLVTGTTSDAPANQTSQVQYVDLGLNLEASLDGMKLRTLVEQSSLAEEKSGVGPQDPIIRQTKLEETSNLSQNGPVILGELDIPGSPRHLEIEVASEPVR